MIKRKIITATALTMFSAVAIAGTVFLVPVEVLLNDDGSGTARGSMSTARYSENNVELIGCGTRNIDIGGGTLFEFGFCQATDANDTAVFCSTDNPDLVKSIRAISAYAFLIFSWDANLQCNRIGMSTQSIHLPDGKQTKK